MSIVVKDLSYVYSPNSPFMYKALEKVSFNIDDGEWAFIVGHTGSGKSTLIQHFNGLIPIQEGSININGAELSSKDTNLKQLRASVGMVFQYPEYQLFAETVEKDIAFGPTNLKLDQEEITRRVKDSMQLVGLDYEEFRLRSPFELSGGQKRRVAIAGVLALKPTILILDEPTAGLDPNGKREVLKFLKSLNESGMTIITVSHDMDDVANYATRVIVIDNGTIRFNGKPVDFFDSKIDLNSLGLELPKAKKLEQLLNQKGINIDLGITYDSAIKAIKDRIKWETYHLDNIIL